MRYQGIRCVQYPGWGYSDEGLSHFQSLLLFFYQILLGWNVDLLCCYTKSSVCVCDVTSLENMPATPTTCTSDTMDLVVLFKSCARSHVHHCILQGQTVQQHKFSACKKNYSDFYSDMLTVHLNKSRTHMFGITMPSAISNPREMRRMRLKKYCVNVG